MHAGLDQVLADVLHDLGALRCGHGRGGDGGAGGCDGVGALFRLGALAHELGVGQVLVLLARERLGRGLRQCFEAIRRVGVAVFRCLCGREGETATARCIVVVSAGVERDRWSP